MKKIIIFGTGGFYKRYAHKIDFEKNDIIAFIDNNPKMVGSIFENKQVFNPKDIKKMNFDKIVIMSTYVGEMACQLIKLGVEENKIYVYEMQKKKFINNLLEYGLTRDECNVKNPKGKKIMLFTHDLSLTGAPMALKCAAQTLKEEGYTPIIISPKSGPLIDEYLKLEIAVIICPFLCLESLSFKKLIKEVDLFIVNTLTLYYVIEELSNLGIPVIWWLHEGKREYEMTEKKLPKCIGNNVYIYSVSEYAKRFWKNTKINMELKILLYGVPDRIKENKCFNENRKYENIIFSIIGTLDLRKGQDIFIKAINYLPKEYKNKIECLIVGGTMNMEFSNILHKLANNTPQIKFINELSNDKLMKIYENSSIIVNSSRDDPMPMVLSEGMMMRRACICTNNTGTASLINNWENGVVFEADNYIKLADIMMYIIDNPSCIEVMGNNARKTYEKIFAYSVFKKNFVNEIRKLLC